MHLQETQDELTTELVDLKDKYREVVELLRDAQEDLRRNRKRTSEGPAPVICQAKGRLL